MRRWIFSLILLSTWTPIPAAEAIQFSGDEYAPGRYIAVLRPGVARWGDEPATAGRSVTEVAAEIAVFYGGTLGHIYEYALQGFSIALTESEAMALSTDSRIDYLEQDAYIHPLETQLDPPWGLDRIDQRNLPLSRSYTYRLRGAGVHAYVLDTGIRSSHVELRGRVEPGFDAILGLSAEDCHGHGTNVAGIVGGATYGVAKGVTLIPVRVLDCVFDQEPSQVRGLTSQAAKGLDWIIQNHAEGQPAVAVLSWAANVFTDTLERALRRTIFDGVSVVAAATMTQDTCNVSTARVPDVMVTGATNSNDQRVFVCSPCIDWYAPGVNVPTVGWLSDTHQEAKSGTSMAAAHAAGVAALYLERHPDASPADVQRGVSDNNTQDIITCNDQGAQLMFTDL